MIIRKHKGNNVYENLKLFGILIFTLGCSPHHANAVSDQLTIEAEKGQGKKSVFSVVNNSSASGGKTLQIKKRESTNFSATAKRKSQKVDILEYKVNIPKKAKYKVWFRVKAQESKHDSFFLKVGNSQFLNQDLPETSGKWRWVSFKKFGSGKTLSKGVKTFKIKNRENGVLIDKFIVTSKLNYKPRTKSAKAPEDRNIKGDSPPDSNPPEDTPPQDSPPNGSPEFDFDVSRNCEDKIQNSRVVNVYPGDSLQDVLDNARPGDVIKVHRGTYNGSIKLKGVKGTLENPILMVSADGVGAAKIVATRGSKSAIEAGGESRYFGIYGFEIVANSSASKANDGNDAGGIKFYNKVNHFVLSGNLVTGYGIDGIKLSGGSHHAYVIGNRIDGQFLESAFDNVWVLDSIWAYNTTAGTMINGFAGKNGSERLELYQNKFGGTVSAHAISIGGTGGSRLDRLDEDNGGVRPDGFEAFKFLVHENLIDTNHSKEVVFSGSKESTLKNNYISGYIRSRESNSQPYSHQSRDNKIIDNIITIDNPYRPDDGQGKGTVVSGTQRTGTRFPAGTEAMPFPYLNICPE